MKKKIKDLVEQAGYKESGASGIIGMDEFLDKFAWLIIEECASKADKAYRQGGGTYGELIRKEFGYFDND